MAKIILNNKEYNVDDAMLASISNELKNHFTNVVNGSGATIEFGGATYSIDSTKLLTATSDVVAHLDTIAGNGAKVTIGGVEYNVDSNKVASAVTELEDTLDSLKLVVLTLAPGLYQPGAIALCEAGDYEAASAMLKTSWEELEASGAVVVSDGQPILPDDLPEKNAYGFYYGVRYSMTVDDASVGLAFHEDGSFDIYGEGETQSAPAGTAVYSNGVIDLSAMGAGVGAVSSDGTAVTFADAGMMLTLGTPVPPKGTLYLGETTLAGELLLPDDGSILSISPGAFASQTLLTNIIIPTSVVTIGGGSFYNCTSLTSVTFAEGSQLTTIDNAAFQRTALTSITVPASVTTIGSSVFSGCSQLESMTLPFVGGSATETTGSSSNLFGYIFGPTSYDGGQAADQKYRVKHSQYTEVKTITYYIPASLQTVTITGGNQLYGAFSGCTSLQSVIIPEGITTIDKYAFNNCTSLTSIELPASVTTIDGMAFSGCTSLVNVVLPEGVTSIGPAAFNDCTSLTSIEIPEGVEIISNDTFENCTSLTSVVIPKGVTTISEDVFNDCTSLASVVFEEGSQLITILSGAFYNCTSLESVTIPSSVTTIGGGNYLGAFRDCTNLSSVTFEEDSQLATIEISTFRGCASLKSIVIPASVITICPFSFKDCASLDAITFEGTVERWNAITKGDDWNSSVPATHVQCSDGQVAL